MITPRISIEITRSLERKGDYAAAVDGLAFRSTVFLARAAYDRVARRGQPKRSFAGYNTRRGKVVSPRYPVTGGKLTSRGARNMAPGELHRQVRRGSFFVSGGMWGGLSVLVISRTMARSAFRGRSEGQGMALKANGADPYFDSKGRPRPRKVNNALKAGTVLRSTGVHVLDPLPREIVGLTRVAVASMASAVEAGMAAELVWSARDRSALGSALEAGFGGGGLRRSVVIGRMAR